MVSVLINNHNYGQYVGEAIESVLKQTYQDFELIIVDGGSTDNSREVILSYMQQYPQRITALFKPTSGQAAAFNAGFQLSRGDIIAFLDSDDYFYETKLEEIVAMHQTYDCVGHGRRQFNAAGKLTEVIAPPDEPAKRSELLHKYGYIYTYSLITACISIKRSILEQILPMPEEDYMTFADCYVKVMAQYYCNIGYIEKPLSYYRIHQAQRNQAFEDEKRANEFTVDLYKRVFRDINQVLKKRGEREIPQMTPQGLREAFRIANPTTNLYEGASYAIYGAGINSYKIWNIIHTIGGKVLFVTDSNPEKWGTVWNGLTILRPEEVVNRRNEYEQMIIGTTSYHKEISETLESFGLEIKKDFSVVNSLPND